MDRMLNKEYRFIISVLIYEESSTRKEKIMVQVSFLFLLPTSESIPNIVNIDHESFVREKNYILYYLRKLLLTFYLTMFSRKHFS